LLIYGRLDEARIHLQSDALMNEVDRDIVKQDWARYWLAELLNLSGEYKTAAAQARRLAARQAEPYNLFALRAAAEVAFESGALPELTSATAKIGQIRERYPSTRSTAFHQQSMGLMAARAGRLTDARKLLRQA